jgi:hypothetical protein
MTDNCAAYRSMACRLLGLRHLRTRAHRPSTNAKGGAVHPHDAERGPSPRSIRIPSSVVVLPFPDGVERYNA